MLQLANGIIQTGVLGKGLKSPLTVSTSTGDFEGVEEAENVAQCIRDLLSVSVGERVMNEDWGSRFPKLLFSTIDGALAAMPKMAIDTILDNEPRVKNVTAKARQAGPKGIELEVDYVIRSTGVRGNLVYPYYVEPTAGGVT